MVVCITKEEHWRTKQMELMCHAYKCRNKTTAVEISDHLAITHREIMNTAAVMRPKPEPLQVVDFYIYNFFLF